MNEIIKRFVETILTLFGLSMAQAVIEEIDRYLYSPAERRRRARYSRATGMYGRPYSGPSRDISEKLERYTVDIDENESSVREQLLHNGGYHDVLMVAFDIVGPNKEAVHQWLQDQMPETGDHPVGYIKGERSKNINLDSWWIADDDAYGDQDSAIFVPKGQQHECRELLANHNFRDDRCG